MEVCLKVLHRLLRKGAIEQHRLLANLTLEVVPPIVLLGVGKVVHLHIEICTQEVLVRCLTDIFVEVLVGDALRAGNTLVGLYIELLQQILPLRQVARNDTRR